MTDFTKRKGFLKKEVLGKDSMGIQKTMTKIDYLADSSGQFALNIMSGIVGQLTYFYTEKVGIAAGAVATVLLVSNLISTTTDLFMGKIMDNSHSKKGKVRPWFLRMALPSTLSVILLFIISNSWSLNIQMIYMLISTVFLTGICFTAVGIPYASIMALRTKSQEERSKMGAFRAATGYISGMIIAILTIPITNILGGDQSAWIKYMTILGLLCGLSLFILYRRSKETSGTELVVNDYEISNNEHTSFKDSIKILLKNKYWVIMLIVQFFLQINFGLTGASGAYYAKWVLGNDNLVGVLGAVGLVPTFIGFLIISPMVKRFGVTNTMKISVAMIGIASVVRAFMPSSFIATIVMGALTTLGTIPPMALVTVMVNNCVDYNEWKSGKRLLGLTNSAISFGGKLGAGVGASLIGWFLALGGYNAAATVQTQNAIYAIYGFTIYVPIILSIIMYLALRNYDLESRYQQIISEIEERKKK